MSSIGSLATLGSRSGERLLEDPGIGGAAVVMQLRGGEEQRDLARGALDRIGAVDEVAPDVDAEVAADRAGRRLARAGLAYRRADGLDGAVALEDGGDYWAG